MLLQMALIRSFLWLNNIPLRGFPGGSVVKNPPANVGDSGSISGCGKSPREGNGNPLQYSCLGNPMDRGAWRATVRGVVRVRHDLVTKQQHQISHCIQALHLLYPSLCQWTLGSLPCPGYCKQCCNGHRSAPIRRPHF